MSEPIAYVHIEGGQVWRAKDGSRTIQVRGPGVSPGYWYVTGPKRSIFAGDLLRDYDLTEEKTA